MSGEIYSYRHGIPFEGEISKKKKFKQNQTKSKNKLKSNRKSFQTKIL